MTRSTLGRWVVRERRLIAILGPFVLISAVGLAWMFFAQRDPARYVATLDSLPLPPTWDVVRTDAQRGLIYPTRADRYYLVEADPEEAVGTLKDAMRAAGFEIYTRDAPADWCDPHPLDSIVVACPTKVVDDCHENGPGGPISCFVRAFRRIGTDPERLERLYAGLSPRGSPIDYGPGASPRYISDPKRALVVITADLSDPRYFWSSPTPVPTSDRPSP